MQAWLKIVAWVAGVIGVAVAVLYGLVFDVWTVPVDDPLLSASIEPTLGAGDVVIVSRHASVARGNLLRCADPQSPGRFVIARAIGRGGDRVNVAAEVVSIDGKRTSSPRRCDPPTVTIHDPNTNDDVDLVCGVEAYGEVDFDALRSSSKPEPPATATVEPGMWYLLSDDRHVHLDSRDYGQVDPATCQHIIFRLVSAAGLGDDKKRLTIIW
jgi:signal peptidase I